MAVLFQVCNCRFHPVLSPNDLPIEGMLGKGFSMPKLVNVRADLKIPVIGGVSGTWQPDKSEINAAWELYVEMVTRAPLGDIVLSDGSVRETLTSLYSLFESARSILRRYGPGVAKPKRGKKLSFGYLAVSMLNLVLRPLLSKWHPELQAWESANPGIVDNEWPDRCNFLKALADTREQLSQYAALFAEVADVPDLTGGAGGSSSTT